jgi:hypothetical protein
MDIGCDIVTEQHRLLQQELMLLRRLGNRDAIQLAQLNDARHWMSLADEHVTALPTLLRFATDQIVTRHISRVRDYHNYARACLTAITDISL